MNRFSVLTLLVVGSLPFSFGCASKSYVRNQVNPLVNRVNELDEVSSKNTKDIRSVEQGVQQADSKATAADQNAQAAGQAADHANQNATQAGKRVTSLAGTVENLDNYKSVSDTLVWFGVNQSALTPKGKQALDVFAQEFQSQKHYILQIEGYADSTGSAAYNYQLSQRRADAVVQYLAVKYKVPVFRIFVIGLGKDNPVAQNTSAAGRAQNRRVDVRLMTNSLDESASVQSPVAAQHAPE